MTAPETAYAVIFDMDGVLVDSIEPHYATWESIAQDLGKHLDYQEFRRLFGQAYPAYFTAMGAGALAETEKRRLSALKEQRYRELVAVKIPVLPGVSDLIQQLFAAGFLLAIGSSGSAENVALIREKLPHGNLFHAWTCGDEVPAAKPAPDIFLKAAEKLQVAPQNCAVIEDSIHGLIAAKAAAMKAVGITTTSPREFLAPQADLVVTAMAELSPEKIRALWD
jgi:HAD superfamily hydrolase (TIGR01509 family)